jgi:hypothetical protein
MLHLARDDKYGYVLRGGRLLCAFFTLYPINVFYSLWPGIRLLDRG